MKTFSLKKLGFVLANATAWLCIETMLPALAESTSISNVSQDVFSCMKKHTRSALGSIAYDGGNTGQIVVYGTGVGQVGKVSYSFDADQQALILTYVQGPASFTQIQSGLIDTANKCKNGEYS
jgi:hypothetical protein